MKLTQENFDKLCKLMNDNVHEIGASIVVIKNDINWLKRLFGKG